jgi:MFS family permease
VYRIQSTGALARGSRDLLGAGRSLPVGRTVVLLGLTSLFTDISSEMVAAVLPLYLASVAGFAPVAIGVVDGVQRGGAALASLVGGVAGDRTRRHRDVAAAGYGTSALARCLLVAGGTAAPLIGGAVLLDRLGKGVRTAPRDAMISLSAPPEHLGMAFGVHRAMDTTGALLGPLVAFLILAAMPAAYGTVWMASLCAALIGLGIITLFVREPARRGGPAHGRAPRVAELVRAVARDRRIRRLTGIAIVLGLTGTSDAFVYLALRDRAGVGAAAFPLLFLGTALVYMSLAVPAGRLADRVGRGRTFLGGSALMVAVELTLLVAPGAGLGTVVLAVALLGTYYAATDGVLAALASESLTERARGTGLSVVATGASVAKLIGSILFGVLWTTAGLHTALVSFALAGAVALALSAGLLVLAHD